MKISDYPQKSSLAPDDFFIADGSGTTKRISAADMPYAIMDGIPAMHGNLMRGNNLGQKVTPAQLAAIQNGTFSNIWLGDYWLYNGIHWRVVDINYWQDFGSLTRPHVVLMPDENVFRSPMYASNNASHGYYNSALRVAIDRAKDAAAVVAGNESYILSHYSEMQKQWHAGNNPWENYTSATAVESVKAIVPTERQIYGTSVRASYQNGSTGVDAVDVQQLRYFAMGGNVAGMNDPFWLRDQTWSNYYACCAYGSFARDRIQSDSIGVRPIVAVG